MNVMGVMFHMKRWSRVGEMIRMIFLCTEYEKMSVYKDIYLGLIMSM